MVASSYKLIAILFGIGVTLHNFEEALFMVDWARSHVKLWFEPNHKIYWVLTSLVSMVVWIPVIGVCVSPHPSGFQDALSGFALTMAINAFVPHLILSLVKHSYAPGAGTGMLLNLPLGVWLIRHQLTDAVSPGQVWRSAIFYALLLTVGTLGSLYAAHAILPAKKV
jgi:hypothetical protein